MRMPPVTLALLFAALAACSPGATPVAQVPTATPTLIPAPTAAPTAGFVALEGAGVAEEVPEWMTLPLTDARTGETFRLADFAGKTVWVEPMATWCTNCRAQQNIVRGARETLADPNFIFISLSVETSLPMADLATYSQNENFPWTFSVVSTEMLQALVSHFGRTIATPPSTPHFIISPSGAISGLSTGQHSAELIINELRAAAAA